MKNQSATSYKHSPAHELTFPGQIPLPLFNKRNQPSQNLFCPRQSVFLQQLKEMKIKTCKIKGFCFNTFCWFYFLLWRILLHQCQLLELICECHSWPNSHLQPLKTCSQGDARKQLSYPLLKRQCTQHRKTRAPASATTCCTQSPD